MKPFCAAVAALLVSALLPAGRAIAAGPGALDVTDGLGTYVAGQVLVKFRPGVTPQARRAALAARGHEILAELRAPGWAVVSVGAGQTVAEAVAAYADDPGVVHAQPDFVYRLLRTPDDPLYGQVWALENSGQTITNGHTQPPGSSVGYDTNNPGTAGADIGVERAWDTLTDCRGVVVAVLDTGVNYAHVDLAANMWDGGPEAPHHGWNSVEDDDDPMDTDGHGTHVAGTIGAVGDNGTGVAGVCWQASIMAVRVIDLFGAARTSYVVDGIHWAIERGARVINMSLGGPGMWDEAFGSAIAAAMDRDVAVVVAAGNASSDNDTSAFWPCNFTLTRPNVICVAALDQAYDMASFSNFGVRSVTVGAPGTNTVSTYAGTAGVITDPLMGGWTITGGWNYATFAFTSGPAAILADPGTFPLGTYLKSANDRAYKAFPVPAVDIALLKVHSSVNVSSGDYFRIASQAGGGAPDPFAGGGTELFSVTDVLTGLGRFYQLTGDLRTCRNATCTVGFQLQSAATGAAAMGVAVTDFRISTLTWNDASYATLSGTSMASPAVAGVVALVRAHNPQYTYADALNSVTASGRDVPALAGKTRTGKAVDAMRALSFIQPPTGLVATVQ